MGQTMLLDTWRFKSAKDNDWLPATVPGCVHTDLLHNDRIPNPFYATNEHDLQWIDKLDWEYEAYFTPSAEFLQEEHQELHFKGLDTYADVFVNEKLVLSANNMFRSWKIDVTGLLHGEENHIRILFRSPIQEDLPKLHALGYPLPATNDQSELGGLGEQKLSIFARKAPYHYGWDWGPRFVTSGIWREVELVSWTGVIVRDLFIDQLSVAAQSAKLAAKVTVTVEKSGSLQLQVQSDDKSWELVTEVEAGEHILTLPIAIDQPKLWWSNGLGEPNRYQFNTVVTLQDDSISHSTQATITTGLRTVKLVRDRDAEGTGATFHFELNGVAVFAKGANHIPNDSFISEVTEDRYRAEIMSAVESNMNMLRVWGGGIYEADAFYDLCDEYGIMVWQDFIFACSMYPGDEEFLQNVRAEAVDNVKRLRNHPSLVLWCGNNEIDSAWAHYDEHGGWGWKKDYEPAIREKLWADYEKIFHELLPDVVAELHPTIEYWPSSPIVSVSHDLAQHAHPLTNEGDVHYWGVWHNVEPFENYQLKIGRFMSEYGFQSFPEYRTIRSFAEESDLAIDTKVMMAHQKNGDGNRLIKEYMDMYMSQPTDFKGFLYLSQVLQADAMQMAIESHRRKMPYCMGSLYWQMNDCWPVASWSGIDYYGRWKALNYYARRSFANILLSAQVEDDDLAIYLVSDKLQSVSGTLLVQLRHMSGEVLHEEQAEVTLPVNTAEVVKRLTISHLLKGHNEAEVFVSASWSANSGETAQTIHYFVKNQNLLLQQPQIEVSETVESGATIVTLQSKSLAKQVVLSSEVDGIWSDNYFDLIPGEPYKVTFTTLDRASCYAGKVEVKSMVDFIVKDAKVTV